MSSEEVAPATKASSTAEPTVESTDSIVVGSKDVQDVKVEPTAEALHSEPSSKEENGPSTTLDSTTAPDNMTIPVVDGPAAVSPTAETAIFPSYDAITPVKELISTPYIADEPQSTATVMEAKVATTPLSKLLKELPSILEQAEHNEMWGITLADESHVPTCIVAEKFLRANNKDVDKAKAQLIEALKWRKHMNPLKLLTETEFSRVKFGNLGYVTTYDRIDGKGKEIITWNIYGAVKNLKETFGDIEEFIKWRCALMELSVRELDLSSATVKIPENGPDPYRMIQVHDYLSVSFLRMDPAVRAASKEAIRVFSMAYPELLKEKFFVNVPLVMSWVFSAMKIFLSEETVKKFHPLSSGSGLAREVSGVGNQLPTVYGGKGRDIHEGLTVMYSKNDNQTKPTGGSA